MLADLPNFEKETTLVMCTGIQFLDFGVSMDRYINSSGGFVFSESNRSVVRLSYNEEEGTYHSPFSTNKAKIRQKYEVSMKETLKIFEGEWVPLPFFRVKDKDFYEGPTTWARARIVSVEGKDDIEQTSHRLTLAFDTNVMDSSGDTQYLAPTVSDVESGKVFSFAGPSSNIGWFIEQSWVDEWLQEVFKEKALDLLKYSEEEIDEELQSFMHLAHYLNVLALLEEKFEVPTVRILSNTNDSNIFPGGTKPINVDFVLDIGNSRTCGILIEDYLQDQDSLNNRYELSLRDLSQPECCYKEPFESRLEFSRVFLGKHASASGRGDAFLWPTIARVGPEAARLASCKRGTEGSTGISSAKRYLWDRARFEPGWKFNLANKRSGSENNATARPFSNLINEKGEPLFNLDEDEMSAFHSHYSRSSLMTFMLSEVLVHALMQINSPGQRLNQSYSDQPRRLRSITLTVPPSMPKPERVIFESCMNNAVGIIWKAFGWHPEDAPVDLNEEESANPPFPQISTQWDEATCGQLVYLFSEGYNNFAGRMGDFLKIMRRKRLETAANDHEGRITIASIDIGGGTTDLTITDYEMEGGPENTSNAYLKPIQRFRDGFKTAGDDIVLDVIHHLIQPSIKVALKKAGISSVDSFLENLIGDDPKNTAQMKEERKRLTLQLFYPVALSILGLYEKYDPCVGHQSQTLSIRDLLEEQPSGDMVSYVSDKVQRQLIEEQGHSIGETFDILSVPVKIDLDFFHSKFMNNHLEICKTLKSLSEIIYLYHPDVLLLTGRPSRLPGIKQVLKALRPLPADRIVPMHNYHCGNWYPFHKNGRIDDPKTTAVVGAMLCLLGQGGISRFYFRSQDLKHYSTVRFVGFIDDNYTIKSNEVYYSDVDLDNEEYELPEDVSIELRGRQNLGFRQLRAERWVASPIYEILLNEKIGDKLYRNNQGASESGNSSPVINVKLRRKRNSKNHELEITNPTSEDLGHVNRNSATMVLNTMGNTGLSGNTYWLDTGCIFKRK